MNKKELAACVALRLGTSNDVGARAVDAVLDAIVDGVVSEKKVTIAGYGSFSLRKRAARMGRNPRTGEPIAISESFSMGFTQSGKLQKLIEENIGIKLVN